MSWHVKPSFTLTYGFGLESRNAYALRTKRQASAIGGFQQSAGHRQRPLIADRESAALQGADYTLQLGYTLIRNVGAAAKYPYNPYYGEFSPRVSFAWNPRLTDGILGKAFGSGKTVIRGGYSRIFGSA